LAIGALMRSLGSAQDHRIASAIRHPIGVESSPGDRETGFRRAKVPPSFHVELFASNLRDLRTVRVAPRDLWCSNNERDDLGDDLVPDLITRGRDGAFYGWPWYIWAPTKIHDIGANGQTSRKRSQCPTC
jgi:glucose/arabinose dehydrogenase